MSIHLGMAELDVTRNAVEGFSEVEFNSTATLHSIPLKVAVGAQLRPCVTLLYAFS